MLLAALAAQRTCIYHSKPSRFVIRFHLYQHFYIDINPVYCHKVCVSVNTTTELFPLHTLLLPNFDRWKYSPLLNRLTKDTENNLYFSRYASCLWQSWPVF